ncbi:hypothetical protein ACPWR0_21875 [Pandoraea pneumonica]|uniref:hypothetical protein n=1 Tax=Pandoraea pneumonica TaxID=2508299 RepID=UPI003CE6FA6F
MARIKIPPQLGSLVEGRKHIDISASNIRDVFLTIDELFPMVRSQIFDANGKVRDFVGLFVEGVQIREISDENQTVSEDGEILIVIAVAGG